MLVMALAFGMAVVGCDHETPSNEFNLDELLRKYMGSYPQTWDDGDEGEVYYLDHLRFDAFKTELVPCLV
jgi:hypothetical protein